MSRLESMRRRLTAQIDGLGWAADVTKDLPGDVLDIGLGNGRTYNHLREILPDRRIWVIDREMNAHPSSVPPQEDFLRGEADEKLKLLAETGHKMAFIHYDLGIGVAEEDAALCALIAPLLPPLLHSKGVVVSGQPLPGLSRVEGPGLDEPDRYYFYKVAKKRGRKA